MHHKPSQQMQTSKISKSPVIMPCDQNSPRHFSPSGRERERGAVLNESSGCGPVRQAGSRCPRTVGNTEQYIARQHIWLGHCGPRGQLAPTRQDSNCQPRGAGAARCYELGADSHAQSADARLPACLAGPLRSTRPASLHNAGLKLSPFSHHDPVIRKI